MDKSGYKKIILLRRLVAAEEKVRDSGQQVLELEMKLNRIQKESIILEERNKILTSQLQNSVPTTPTEVLQVSHPEVPGALVIHGGVPAST